MRRHHAGSVRRVPHIDETEELAIEKTRRTISTIENALNVWKLSERKPKKLGARVKRLKRLHDALHRWEMKALRAHNLGDSLVGKLGRLEEFHELCEHFELGDSV